MPPTESVDCVPVLLTHWDPDMYSSDALPLIPELVIQILVHGEVWLKEVDLFLTATIQEQFDREEQFEQFSSLVETGRVKVLIPDESYKLIDPGTQPLLATAIERELSKRPLATAEWRLTNSVRRYCERLDRVLVRADAIRRRQLPPNENVFAGTLSRVLSLPEVTWHGRPQFTGLDDAICAPFRSFCEDHRNAIAFLLERDQKPRGDGFFRSMAYQCADCFPQQSRPMKNLIQSVYAACELEREGAAGTFVGEKIAEIPPTSLSQATAEDSKELISVRIESGLPAANIPICRNIGEVVDAVLRECGHTMQTFWDSAQYDVNPEGEFRLAWAHVAGSRPAFSAGATSRTRPKGKALLEHSRTGDFRGQCRGVFGRSFRV